MKNVEDTRDSAVRCERTLRGNSIPGQCPSATRSLSEVEVQGPGRRTASLFPLSR